MVEILEELERSEAAKILAFLPLEKSSELLRELHDKDAEGDSGPIHGMNPMLSVILGGLVPLFLKRMKVDPALASGPILTTCTDMCGFFLVLTFASAVLSHLAGV